MGRRSGDQHCRSGRPRAETRARHSALVESVTWTVDMRRSEDSYEFDCDGELTNIAEDQVTVHSPEFGAGDSKFNALNDLAVMGMMRAEEQEILNAWDFDELKPDCVNLDSADF